MRYLLGLLIGLLSLWLLLSGHYSPMLLVLGGLSCVFAAWVCHRLGLIDSESVPIELLPRLPAYLLWLAWEIMRCNIDVAWRILRPGRHISPTLVTLTAHQQTALGRAIFANSITLTPGTVAISLRGGQAEVHALSAASSRGIEGGRMDQRVRRLESGLVGRDR